MGYFGSGSSSQPPPLPDRLPVDERSSDEVVLTPPATLYEATVSVRWDADPSSPSTSLHTLVAFAPAPPALIEKEELEEPREENIP